MTRTSTSHLLFGSAPSKQAKHRILALGVVAAAMVAVSCSSASVISSGEGGSNGQGGGGGIGGVTSGGGAGGGVTINTAIPDANLSVDRPSGGTCGDGVIERNEGCDDGNTVSGDGCSRICQVESNWYCPQEGQPCQNLAKCGNGILTSDETCDDGNTVSGDGCSADCKTVEKGFQCRVPGKPCTPRCGDGIISGFEACDDGNTNSGRRLLGNLPPGNWLQVQRDSEQVLADDLWRRQEGRRRELRRRQHHALRRLFRGLPDRTVVHGRQRMHLTVWRRHRARRRLRRRQCR
jgi:cysteine-rich repeat protein